MFTGLFETAGELVNKGVIQRVALDKFLVDSLEESAVTVEANLQVIVGNFILMADQRANILRLAEVHQARFRHGVDGDDVATIFLTAAQRGQGARVVSTRILADGDKQIRGVNVVDGDGAFTQADGLA